MKILLITEFFTSPEKQIFSGGVETRCFYIAKYLSSQNQVFVICRRRKEELKFEQKDNLIIYRLGREIQSTEANIFSIIDRLIFQFLAFFKGLQLRIDLVEGSNYICFLPAFFVGFFKRIPKVAWYPDVLKGSWQEQFGLFLGFFGELGEFIFLKLSWDQFITISLYVKEKLIKNRVSKNKIKIIACGVDLQLINKSKFIKKEDQIIVVSRLINYKRVDWTINLINQIREKFPKLKLKIIGIGPEEKKLIFLTGKLRLNKKVEFVKNIKSMQLYEEIAKSKLLLHPSLVEGFGIVLLEATALQTPFIASDIPTSLYLQKQLNSGLVFKKNDFDDFLDQTKIILNNDKEYKRLQTNGMKNIEYFDWKKLTQDTEEVYKEIVKKLS
ncbi:glycosyltransferase family 4 protein [Candidatus Beckwithbacteria bacterium]|nr:glycosyltransferase family 4 protein [Candidatus Beckwithbacteria bacterium]